MSLEDATADGAGRRFDARDAVGATGLVVWAAALAYDYALPPGRPTVAAGGYVWDATDLDWLFVLTLGAAGYAVVWPLARNRRLARYYWRRFRQNRLALVSVAYLAVVFVLGTAGPAVLSPPSIDLAAGFQPPAYLSVDASVPVSCVGPTSDGRCYGTLAHPLGTTGDGKDIAVLVVYGMQVSMKLGLITTLLVVSIGTTVGAVAAYAGGLVDEALMRYVDVQLTFPTFLLYLLLVYLFEGGLFLFVVIFGLTSWGGIARLVRAEALQLAEEDYVRSARVAGATPWHVVRYHLVPNVSGTVITAATLAIPGYILAEAALSFLQLGDPTLPSWGQVIAAGRSDLGDAWWISTIPGVFLFLTILAFNFVGDALRDALDPRAES
jgi:peptide/nickel transport system permease protein